MNIQMLNPFVEGNAYDPIPLDYLSERGASTNAFTRKEVENVLQSVMSGYNSFSGTRQHDISLLVLQLEDLMTSDEINCEPIEGQDNTFLLAPPTMTLRREPKKRMKPIHELARHKQMKSLQRQGISQILTFDNNEIEIVAPQNDRS